MLFFEQEQIQKKPGKGVSVVCQIKSYYHFARFTNESIVPVPSSKTSLHCMRPIQERKTLSETCEQFFKVKNQMGQTNSGWLKVGSRKGPFTSLCCQAT